MAWPTYSETFVRSQAVATAKTYVVPAGRRAIVKYISVVDYGDVGGYANVQVGGTCVALVLLPVTERNFVRELLAVAYAGQSIYVLTSTAGMHVTVSGWLMSDLSGATGPPPAASPLPTLPDVEPPAIELDQAA